ncbi:unnamed protein product, partial [Fusarium fujikuroi]
SQASADSIARENPPMFSVFVNMVFHGVRYLIRSTLLPDHAVTPKEA